MYINIINPKHGLEENRKWLNPIFYFTFSPVEYYHMSTVKQYWRVKTRSNQMTQQRVFIENSGERVKMERTDQLVVGSSESQ